MERLCALYKSLGVDLGELRSATVAAKDEFAGRIVIGPPSAFHDKWARRFADPLIAFASGWMRIRQRAKQSGVELPLIISDHADWDELTATVKEVAPQELWITHGRDDALARWADLNSVKARPLAIAGYEDEAE
jgi:putative mRNA 3-end processing factor